MPTRPTLADALLGQSRSLLAWLQDLPDDAYERPTVLTGWDTRMLVAHLLLIQRGLVRVLALPTREKPMTASAYVTRYRESVDAIAASTADTAGHWSGPELVAQLADELPAVATALTSPHPPCWTVREDRSGPRTGSRPGWWTWSCTATTSAAASPSGSRSRWSAQRSAGPSAHWPRCSPTPIPDGRWRCGSPHAAVQCGVGDPGPTHTRGTPPNVVETDALTFLRLATGRADWSGPSARVRSAPPVCGPTCPASCPCSRSRARCQLRCRSSPPRFRSLGIGHQPDVAPTVSPRRGLPIARQGLPRPQPQTRSTRCTCTPSC